MMGFRHKNAFPMLVSLMICLGAVPAFAQEATDSVPEAVKEASKQPAVQSDNEPLTAEEIGSFRSQINNCWSLHSAKTPANFEGVTIAIELKQDGSVASIRQLQALDDNLLQDATYKAYYDKSVAAATRAVKRCAPYKLPVAKYRSWKNVEI